MFKYILGVRNTYFDVDVPKQMTYFFNTTCLCDFVLTTEIMDAWFKCRAMIEGCLLVIHNCNPSR